MIRRGEGKTISIRLSMIFFPFLRTKTVYQAVPAEDFLVCRHRRVRLDMSPRLFYIPPGNVYQYTHMFDELRRAYRFFHIICRGASGLRRCKSAASALDCGFHLTLFAPDGSSIGVNFKANDGVPPDPDSLCFFACLGSCSCLMGNHVLLCIHENGKDIQTSGEWCGVVAFGCDSNFLLVYKSLGCRHAGGA